MSHRVKFIVWWVDPTKMQNVVMTFVDAKEWLDLKRMLDNEEIQYSIKKEILL